MLRTTPHTSVGRQGPASCGDSKIRSEATGQSPCPPDLALLLTWLCYHPPAGPACGPSAPQPGCGFGPLLRCVQHQARRDRRWTSTFPGCLPDVPHPPATVGRGPPDEDRDDCRCRNSIRRGFSTARRLRERASALLDPHYSIRMEKAKWLLNPSWKQWGGQGRQTLFNINQSGLFKE